MTRNTIFKERKTLITSSWLNWVDDLLSNGLTKTQAADVATRLDSEVYVNDTRFGAVEGVSVNSGPAIQAAIDYVSAAGGGTVIIPFSTIRTDIPITITSKGVKLKGLGAGFYSSTAIAPVTELVYYGPAGQTVLTLSSVSGASNNKITDCSIDGIAVNGNSLASKCVQVNSVNNCFFNMSAKGATTTQVEFNTVATLADARDSQHNHIEYIRVRATGSSNGIVFDSSNTGTNISMNTMKYLYAYHENGTGILFGNTDNNDVDRLSVYRTSGTGIGVIFGSGNGTTVRPARANVFRCFGPGDGGTLAKGTTYSSEPSGPNFIEYIDKENAAPDPVIDTGALLSWGSNKNATFYKGFAFTGFGDSHASATNAVNDSINTLAPVSIYGNNGKHMRLHNGATGVWSINVAASGGDLRIQKVGSSGGISLPSANMGFNGATPIAKPTITGSKGANAALTSLLTQLAAYGLITDSTT